MPLVVPELIMATSLLVMLSRAEFRLGYLKYEFFFEKLVQLP